MKNSLVILALGLSLSSIAQNDSLLNEVEVYSQKSASELFTAQRVEVLTREDISNTPVTSVNELLEFASTLDVRQRGPFDIQSDISVRGGTFDQTLVLLNGIPMNDPQTGHHNMNLPISIQDIERVEILQGGGSHRYGPYAFSGAINIITRSAEQSSINVEVEGGQYDYYGLNANATYAKEGFGARASVNRAQSSGYLPNSDFFRQNGQLELSYTQENLRIAAEGGINDKGFGAQNFYTSAFPNQYEATRTYFANLRVTSKIGDYLINGNVYNRIHTDRFELYRETGDGWYENINGQYVRGTDSAASWYAGPNFHRTNTTGGELSTKATSAFGNTQLGVDVRNEAILSNNLGMDMDEPISVEGTSFDYTKSDSRTNGGVFFNHRYQVKGLEVSLSLRYNYNTSFGDDWLPGIEASYDINNEVSVYASANRSFRLPTYTDLYYSLGGAQGSIDLLPEYSNNFEIGQTYKQGRFTLNTSVFVRDGENMIDWVVLPTDTTQTLRAQNITELLIYGIDGDIRIQLDDLTKGYVESVRISAAYLNSPTDQFEFESLYALDFLRAKVSMGVVHGLPHGFKLSWQANYQQRNGTYVDFATGESTEFNPVLLLDARLSWNRNHYSIYIDGNNLLDRVYQDRGNVLQPGIWMRIGASWNMTFGN